MGANSPNITKTALIPQDGKTNPNELSLLRRRREVVYRQAEALISKKRRRLVVNEKWFCLRIGQHLRVIGRPLDDAKGGTLLLIARHIRNSGK
jgi:hypothetical protein